MPSNLRQGSEDHVCAALHATTLMSYIAATVYIFESVPVSSSYNLSYCQKYPCCYWQVHTWLSAMLAPMCGAMLMCRISLLHVSNCLVTDYDIGTTLGKTKQVLT